MNKANIMIARCSDGYNIKVEGRATFECSSPIKNFIDNTIVDLIKKVTIDLTSCTWMDSTFMGTLATLGLHAKKADIVVDILNANDKNIKLMKELGIFKLFTFNSITNKTSSNDWEDITSCSQDTNSIAATVLDAHKTLMSVDKQNVPKFKKVVELIKKDIDPQNKE